MSLIRVFFSLLLFALLAACSASRPSALPEAGLRREPVGAMSVDRATGSPSFQLDLQTAFSQRLASRKAEAMIHVIALSGGGAHGAFGAGLMQGWSERGDRPDFDIVTGVSTGALMAPLVFLGPSHDPSLVRLYQNIDATAIYKDRGLFESLRTLSLKDTEPLKQLIASFVDAPFTELLAVEHRKGRRLLIGTTDIDQQRSMIWDLGWIANSQNSNKIQQIRDILLASSAVPLVFPPVYFDIEYKGETFKQMHVDGGIESPVLAPALVEDINLALASVSSASRSINAKLYVLINQQVEAQNLKAVEPSMSSLAISVINHALRSNLRANLDRIRLLGKASRVEVRIEHVPQEIVLEKDSILMDTQEMNLLFDSGQKLGRSSAAWKQH